MIQELIAVAYCQVLYGLLHSVQLHLFRTSTFRTNKMVVVLLRFTNPVQHFSAAAAHRIDMPGLFQHLQIPIHGCKPGATSRLSKRGMNILSTAKHRVLC